MKTKIIALVTAAAVTTGMGAFGTYSFLADSQTISDSVSIKMGKIDVDANFFGTWKSTAKDIQLNDNGLDASNVKVGDLIYRDVVIKNEGTLTSDLTLETLKSFDERINVYVSYTNGETDKDGRPVYKTAYAGESVTFKDVAPGAIIDAQITIDISPDSKFANEEIILPSIHDFIQITAEQQNK